MNTNQSEAVASNAELGQPKPRAWVIFADNGNCRMWTTFQPHIQATADAAGLQVTHLFDQTALDAAVAAERERLIALAARQGWTMSNEDAFEDAVRDICQMTA